MRLGRFSVSADTFSGIVATLVQGLALAAIIWSIKQVVGFDQLGLWSLILSATSVATVGDFGLGMAMIHFSQKTKDGLTDAKESFRGYYHTALAAVAIIVSIILALAFFPLRSLLTTVAGAEHAQTIAETLPIMVVSMLLFILGRVPISSLNGLGYFWVAQIITIIAWLGYLVFALLLLPGWGLQAVATGHLFMSLALLVLGHLCVAVVRADGLGAGLKWLASFRPQWSCLREMYRLSISIQATTLLVFFLEPLARFAVGGAGTLEFVGYYEMASRVTLFVRDLVLRPLAHLSGQFSRLIEKAPEKIPALLEVVFQRGSLFMIVGLTALASGSLWLADSWVGERPAFFFYCILCLGLALQFSVLAIGPYTYGLGSGDNRLNLTSTMIISGLAALGSIAGIILGNPWIIPPSILLGYAVGEAFLILSNAKRLKVKLRLLPMNLLSLLGLFAVGGLLVDFYLLSPNLNLVFRLAIIGVSGGLLSFIAWQGVEKRLRNKQGVAL